ncbi:hypothetical protein Syun_006469 [Stephania yunnanensis]|uniref:HIT-type domain-containing protein n=1 Tax=Stephania yunnanensis TaxID=152371 RepID=A0AAP0KY40_9MAGN
MGPRQCEVCKEAQSKYKCPTCFSPYCSLSCFKTHKETPCEKPVPAEEKTILPISPLQRPIQVDEPSQVLQRTQLESIVLCAEVRDALKDEELQKLIYKIDSSVVAESELDRAMEVEAFRKFTDKVLSTINNQG